MRMLHAICAALALSLLVLAGAPANAAPLSRAGVDLRVDTAKPTEVHYRRRHYRKRYYARHYRPYRHYYYRPYYYRPYVYHYPRRHHYSGFHFYVGPRYRHRYYHW